MLGGIEIDLMQNPAGVLLIRFSEIKQMLSPKRESTLGSYLHELYVAFMNAPERYKNAVACQTSSDLTALLADLDANYHSRSIYSGMREDIAHKLQSRPQIYVYSNRDKSSPQFKAKIASESGIRTDVSEALIEDKDDKRSSPRF